MGIGNMVSGGLAYKGTQNALDQQKKAAKDLTARMEKAQGDVYGRRPQVQQERETALRNQLGLLGPMNSLVGEMGGGRYGLNLGPELAKSPVIMKPLESQYGARDDRGRYDPKTIAALSRQGYDVSDKVRYPTSGTKPGKKSGAK